MSEKVKTDPMYMTTPELIREHGYEAEIHHVWTEDGYCIEMHRVLCRVSEKTPLVTELGDEKLFNDEQHTIETSTQLPLIKHKTSRPPVLIHHGLLSSSSDFVLLGPEKALTYALCDEGFDVWLGNARGNAYSQLHKEFTIRDREFWDFSWHEIGYYDIPALIDYILEKTGHPSLYYIGYSQGTTTFFVMASERPEYNAKIKSMICLAPIAFLWNQRSPLIKLVVRFYMIMEWGSMYCNIHQWFPRNKLQAQALGTFVRTTPTSLTKGFCTSWLYLIAGFGSNQLDKRMLPLIFGHFPAGSSVKQIVHYSQSVLGGSFQKFDYGRLKNMELYNSPLPPKYNLDKVKAPVSIFYSENDFLTHPNDVETLANQLPNVINKYKIEYAKFNHIDYLWGVDAKTLVYDNVIKILKQS